MLISSEKHAQSVIKVGGDQMGLVPKPSKVGGDASHGSHRVVAPMTGTLMQEPAISVYSCLTSQSSALNILSCSASMSTTY